MKKEWKKSSKKERIKIDRTEIVKLDKSELPNDLEFKGYEGRIIQNITIRTDNVMYKPEKYYSALEGKTYIAKLPESLQGTEFRPETKALAASLYYENRVTENKIASFLNSNGLLISEGTVSNILIKEKQAELTAEKQGIYEAGLNSSIYQQTDNTGMRISGKNGYAAIVCNEGYSAYFIEEKKNRETVRRIPEYGKDRVIFKILVCDDAPQFKTITEEEAETLSLSFDALFGQKTGYEELDKRLSLTLAKKDYLLVVLDYPEVPLHNNLSENGECEMVIKRKISVAVETEDGKKALENYMTILGTCKKQGVSFCDYILNIFAAIEQVIPLPQLILQN